MELKNKVLSVVVALAALAPAAAMADHDDDYDFDPSHRHHASCGHAVTPPPGTPAPEAGRYELRTVQKWVEGRYEQVWVPQTCQTRVKNPFRHHMHKVKTVCTGGFYEQQFKPGHYENVQEWVFVPAPRRYYQPARVEVGWPVNGQWTATATYPGVSFQAGGAF